MVAAMALVLLPRIASAAVPDQADVIPSVLRSVSGQPNGLRQPLPPRTPLICYNSFCSERE
jgi:hypothetical protein